MKDSSLIICSVTGKECDAGIDCHTLPEECGNAVDDGGDEITW